MEEKVLVKVRVLQMHSDEDRLIRSLLLFQLQDIPSGQSTDLRMTLLCRDRTQQVIIGTHKVSRAKANSGNIMMK